MRTPQSCFGSLLTFGHLVFFLATNEIQLLLLHQLLLNANDSAPITSLVEVSSARILTHTVANSTLHSSFVSPSEIQDVTSQQVGDWIPMDVAVYPRWRLARAQLAIVAAYR